MLTAKIFRFSRSIAHIWGARCAGSRNPAFSCVLAMAVFITKTALAPPDLRNADYSNTTTRLKTETCRSNPARCPRLAKPQISFARYGHAPDQNYRRVVGCAFANWRNHHGDRRTSHSAPNRQLVLCLWQRRVCRVHAANRYRHTARFYLRPVRRRSLEQPADLESSGLAGVVHSRAARLGFGLYGGDCVDPYGPGIFIRGVQISA